MKLRMFLHDELAATLDTGPGQLATRDTVVWTPEIARVSAAWDETPSLEALTHWLEACLPENGSRAPFEERARALKLDRGEPPLITAPVDILWGNTDAEYPGAVRFQRDDQGDGTEDANEYVRLSDKEIGERLHEAWRIARQAGKGPERTYGERRSSLSGMRGKIGLREPAMAAGGPPAGRPSIRGSRSAKTIRNSLEKRGSRVSANERSCCSGSPPPPP